VAKTTPAKASTATVRASRAGKGRPRCGRGTRGRVSGRAAECRGAGGSWRGRPEEGGRRRTWLGRLRRVVMSGNCRTGASAAHPVELACQGRGRGHKPGRSYSAPTTLLFSTPYERRAADVRQSRPAVAVRCTLVRDAHVRERVRERGGEWRTARPPDGGPRPRRGRRFRCAPRSRSLRVRSSVSARGHILRLACPRSSSDGRTTQIPSRAVTFPDRSGPEPGPLQSPLRAAVRLRPRAGRCPCTLPSRGWSGRWPSRHPLARLYLGRLDTPPRRRTSEGRRGEPHRERSAGSGQERPPGTLQTRLGPASECPACGGTCARTST
jgi:hypothetical protein